jgi:hypothetical protein
MFKVNKKKFAVYGNCQAGPIAKLLLNNEKFSTQFELVNFPQPVYMMSNKDWPEILKVIEGVDLLIYQQVGDAFGSLLNSQNLAAKAKSSAIKISYPSIYFNGYFVEVDYLRGMPSSVNHFSEYHDINIAQNYLLNENIEQAVKQSLAQMKDPNFYSENDVLSRVKLGLDELRSREVELDTQISNFVENNWMSEQLFFSVNHPARRVMLEISYQVLKLLGINNLLIPGNFEHLGETKLPIYQSVKSHLDTQQFPVLRMKGKNIELEHYVRGLVESYVKQDSKLLQNEIGRLRQKKQFVASESDTL